jgi:hypothetical protein
MASMLLTCPESAHLEEVEVEVTRFGTLILRCSAACPLECPRTCAKRMDERRRATGTRLIAVRSLLRGSTAS